MILDVFLNLLILTLFLALQGLPVMYNASALSFFKV